MGDWARQVCTRRDTPTRAPRAQCNFARTPAPPSCPAPRSASPSSRIFCVQRRSRVRASRRPCERASKRELSSLASAPVGKKFSRKPGDAPWRLPRASGANSWRGAARGGVSRGVQRSHCGVGRCARRLGPRAPLVPQALPPGSSSRARCFTAAAAAGSTHRQWPRTGPAGPRTVARSSSPPNCDRTVAPCSTRCTDYFFPCCYCCCAARPTTTAIARERC